MLVQPLINAFGDSARNIIRLTQAEQIGVNGHHAVLGGLVLDTFDQGGLPNLRGEKTTTWVLF